MASLVIGRIGPVKVDIICSSPSFDKNQKLMKKNLRVNNYYSPKTPNMLVIPKFLQY